MAGPGGDASKTTNTSTPASKASDSPEHATTEANGALSNGANESPEQNDGDNAEEPQQADSVFQLTVKLPHVPGQTQIMVSSQEQVQDIRQTIVDTPHTFQYSCFHLEHRGKRVNDFIELSEVPEIVQDPVLELVEDPYTEAQARMHVVRIRELIGASGDRVDLVTGIDAGTSLCDSVELPDEKSAKEDSSPVAHYDLDAPGTVNTILPKSREGPAKTIKSVSLSAWNPPPYHLRMRGHLLYLQVTTNEGEQHYITSHISGFYVNRCTNNKFDPAPKTTPKAFSAHSLITLIGQISPSFDGLFRKLQEYNGERDPLASYQLSNSIPSAPWLVNPSSIQQHQSDLTRSQEPFLLAGADNAETLRDWNEEFQSTRELPKETVQDRVFRERLTSKLFAEYNEAAVRGAVLVARGEVQPLNPTEGKDAQIFVYNNVFFSFGADGVGTFASDGGDEAARVATGKDVQGVKNVNQLDINGLFTAGTVVVDYLGKRVVGQSIVPGIFKQREPGEHQIDYGGVEGKDVIATNESFVTPFSELSKAMRVKQHAVWDKDLKKHELAASVETKGLLGTDGRKYILDLYRITPLDVAWLEKYRGADLAEDKRYLHRMTVLRPELVESYRFGKLREYISKELERKRADREQLQAGQDHGETGAQKTNGEQDNAEVNGDSEKALADGIFEAKKDDTQAKQQQQEAVDISGFSFTLNPDVFSGQQPQTDEEKAEWERDEAEVRAVCRHLTNEVIPRLVHDMQEGDVGFPMDGQSLVREMHKRGVNVRYLGEIARLCSDKTDKRLIALQQLSQQEMVSRAFKHVCNKYLRQVPPVFAQNTVSHLLNCLLGVEYNNKPQAEVDEELKSLYPDVEFGFEQVTPESLTASLQEQVALRYRFDVGSDLVTAGKQLQTLREISLKLGFQLEAKEYQFTKELISQELKEKKSVESLAVPQTNGVHSTLENGKKKKKKHADHSPARSATGSPVLASLTFHPENVFNIVPIVKETSPRSTLAEEALDAGRVSIQQDQKELGQELLLESLSLHEQIYGILHPEVARVYYALSTLYYNLDEKPAAVELAKKAVIVSERTLGIDHAETVLAYLNLSLFEHATGNTRTALAYVRHALDLWKIVYGVRHPDSITTINNAAVMLQTLKQFHESRIWFEASLEICEEVAGKQSINTATLLFQLAQALALDHDSKLAVAKMRESYSIFKAELGPENQNTKEAENWLETLTHSAVNQAKQANLLQNRRLLLSRNGKAPSRVASGTRPQPPAAANTAAAPIPSSVRPAAAGGHDQQSIDELLRYINGESGKERTPKKKQANPKRRQQRAPAGATAGQARTSDDRPISASGSTFPPATTSAASAGPLKDSGSQSAGPAQSQRRVQSPLAGKDKDREKNISNSSSKTPTDSKGKGNNSYFSREKSGASGSASPRGSKSFSSRRKNSEEGEDEHPLNLHPDELRRLSALSFHSHSRTQSRSSFQRSSMSSPIQEKENGAVGAEDVKGDPMVETTPAPEEPATNGNGQAAQETKKKEGPAPPPHRTPASPPPPEKPAVDPEVCKAAGNKFYKAGQYDKAIEEYSKAIEADPQSATYLSNRAAAYMAASRWLEALEDCKNADELEQNSTKIMQRLAKVYTALGRPQEALDVFDRMQPSASAKDKAPAVTMRSHINQAQDSIQTGTSGSMAIHALDQAERGLGSYVQPPRKWKLLRGEALLKMGNVNALGDAQNVAMSLLRTNNADPEALVLRGRALYAQGDNDKAVQHFRQALSCDPDFKDAVKYLRLVQKLDRMKEEGNGHFKSGRYQQAVDTYTSALQVDPLNKGTNSKILNNRAMCFSKQKKWTQAIEDCDQAIRLDPSYTKARKTRAKALGEGGDWDEAVRAYKSIQEQSPEEPGIAKDIKNAELELKKSKRKDYYKILNIEKDASEHEIKRAYKKLAVIHHPDKNIGDPEAENRFKDIQEAHETLVDAQKRERYDSGVDLMEPGDFGGGMGGGGFGGMGGMGGMGGGFGGGGVQIDPEMLFNMMNGGGGGRGGGGFHSFGGGGGRGGFSPFG
nr:clustered mitochondria protein like [Quercus suber]